MSNIGEESIMITHDDKSTKQSTTSYSEENSAKRGTKNLKAKKNCYPFHMPSSSTYENERASVSYSPPPSFSPVPKQNAFDIPSSLNHGTTLVLPLLYVPVDSPMNSDVSPSTNSSTREQNSALKKTKLCDHWRRSGTCSYGRTCWYAHGEDELRKMPVIKSNKASSESTTTLKDVESAATPLNIINIPSPNNIEDSASNENGKSKRMTTNVKGLTVNIPTNITTRESNSSLPLSPAQERWISMSQGNTERGNAEKMDENSIFLNKVENEKRETFFPKMPSSSALNNEEALKWKYENFGDVDSNMNYSYPYRQQQTQNGCYPVRNAGLNSAQSYGNSVYMNRLYSRGASTRNHATLGNVGLQQYQDCTKSRLSNSSNNYYDIGNSQKNGHQMGSRLNGVQQQSTGTIPSSLYLVNEIMRRQKIIEAGGKLDSLNDSEYMGAQLSKSNNYQRPSRFIPHNGMENEATGYLKERNAVYYNRNVENDEANGMYMQYRPADMYSQYEEWATYGLNTKSTFGRRTRAQRENENHVAQPPRMNKSLFPNSDTFTIWCANMVTNDELIGGCVNKNVIDPHSTLLSKMDVISETFLKPSETTNGNVLSDLSNYEDRADNAERTSSPVNVLSLCELLSNENLMDENASIMRTNQIVEQNTFDFDLNKVNYDDNSESSENADTPTSLIVCSEKTPGFKNQEDSKVTNTAKEGNDELERCYFFSVCGTCPFGDSCALIHYLDQV